MLQEAALGWTYLWPLLKNNIQAKISGFKENPSAVILMQTHVNLLLGLWASESFYGQIHVFCLAAEI